MIGAVDINQSFICQSWLQWPQNQINNVETHYAFGQAYKNYDLENEI